MKTNIFKITILLGYFCFFSQTGSADEKIIIDKTERTYKLYVPAEVQGIIVALHPLGGSSSFFFDEYPMKDFADENKYIVLAPQALKEQNPTVISTINLLGTMAGINIPLNAVWGCGMKVNITSPSMSFELNANVADVEFIHQIIAKTLVDYNLPTQNIFIFGVSLGGFMTYLYAEKYPEQLSGIISIAGSRGLAISNTSDVALPVLDFHSEQDETIPYGGLLQVKLSGGTTNVDMAQSKPEVIDYWVNRNGANTVPDVENVNYYTSTNGISVTKYTYTQAQGNEVIHYKMTSSTTGVPEHIYLFSADNGDCMDYAEEIAKFITAHTTDININNINKVLPVTAANVVGYYNILGQKSSKEPEKGLYIILYDNGNAEKILK